MTPNRIGKTSVLILNPTFGFVVSTIVDRTVVTLANRSPTCITSIVKTQSVAPNLCLFGQMSSEKIMHGQLLPGHLQHDQMLTEAFMPSLIKIQQEKWPAINIKNSAGFSSCIIKWLLRLL